MRWPWVSRAVLDAKDDFIRHLLAENQRLREQPIPPVNVHLDIPEGLMVTQPAVFRRVRKEQAPQAEKPIDYANLDENDPHLMAALVLKELGPNPNKYLARQTLRQIRVQIIAARQAKMRPPEQPDKVPQATMPDEIARMIQEADSGNAAAVAELAEKVGK